MNSPETKTSLPTWLFIATDLALIGAAAFIALRSAPPLSTGAMLAIVGCVGLGAIVGLVPLVVRFERQKNETLDDRQRALEALAQTVSSSAEQISIATGSLNEIAELSQKNLRHAEHLPHKLQEKIAEFQAQLAAADDVEKEELERELTALRTSESDRLEAVSTRIGKSAAEWAKLEAASAQHLAAVADAMAKLPVSTASAITKAQATADHALAEARVSAAKTMAEAEGNATQAIALAQSTGLTAVAAKLAEFETQLAATTTTAVDHATSELRNTVDRATGELRSAVERTTGELRSAVERATGELRSAVSSVNGGLDEKIAQLNSLTQKLEALVATIPAVPVAPIPAAQVEPLVPAVDEKTSSSEPAAPADSSASTAETTPAVPLEEVAPPAPKRHRRPRREEVSVTEPAAPVPVTEPALSAAEPAVVAPPEPTIEVTVAAEPVVPPTPVEEPAPILVEKIVEVIPTAPSTAEPFAEQTEAVPLEPDAPASAPSNLPAATEPEAESVQPEPATPPPTPKKRAARKPEPEPEPLLDLPLEDSSASAAPGHVERTFSSDGATRLLATAYIGIGNRLFIRGEGSGLSWEKGVPLQFVSIGKWRWETNDATTPVRFKLYKNDELECTALGEQTLEPGHLQEMTAAF